ncbi:MAG TPA: hypothetical protein VFQ72_00630 [Candidatus Paceibacterota bacterium]|nr:hypothetical protein [Candidatus Paceibacterota bacterium]
MDTTREKEEKIGRSIEVALDALSDCLDDASPIFSDALMLSCLAHVPGARADTLKDALARRLTAERNDRWAWNYRRKARQAAAVKRFPDDLDDTACALISLKESGRLDISPQILALFAQHLIASERQPGGPYGTWIAPGKGAKNDFDPAVNANIAYFLALNGIFLDGLESFLLEAFQMPTPASLYYHDPLLPYYFLSRYLSLAKSDKRPAAQIAKEVALKEARKALVRPETNVLGRALAACICARLGGVEEASSAVDAIVEAQGQNGLWQADPLYIEEMREGQPVYFESATVTTAFCLEALEAHRSKSRAEPEKSSDDAALAETAEKFASLFSGPLACFERQALEQLGRLRRNGIEKLAALLPFKATKGPDRPGGRGLAVSLGAANLCGWIGYTIQDDAMDEGRSLQLLPLANVCLRLAEGILRQLAPDAAFASYSKEALDRIDAANHQESFGGAAARLSDKSFGHALGPLLLLSRAGHGPGSALFASLESFFVHYLTARQMSDDAHDWEADLAQGRINSAAAALFRLVPRTASAEALQRAFWDKAIDRIARRIHYHASTARLHARACGTAVHAAYLESLLVPIERSARRAIEERNKALDFLSAFRTPNTATAPAGPGASAESL